MPVKKTNILTEKYAELRKPMPKMAKEMEKSDSEIPKKKTKVILLKPSKIEKTTESNIEKTQAQKAAEEEKIIARQKGEYRAKKYLEAAGKGFPSKYKFEYMSKMPNVKSKYSVQSNEKIENPKEYFEKKEYIENMGKKGKI